MNAKQLIENILKLQSLELELAEAGDAAELAVEQNITQLRLQIPSPILSHYDRLGQRGKKGVAAVRHQTCTGCHVQVTKGTVLNLIHGDDIQVCESCGRYLYLAPSEEPNLPAVAPAKKTAAKTRKRAEVAYAG